MNTIKKWGKLEQKQAMINPYDFGGILSSTLSGAAAGSAIPGWGTVIGAGVGLIGGLIGNKKQKESQKQQEEMMRQQLLAQKESMMLAAPQSSGGIGTQFNFGKVKSPVGNFDFGGYLTPEILAKSGIHIKPENRGKFTATKARTGKSTEELTHSKNPLTRKRAIFAQNAKKWKHEDGGYLESILKSTKGGSVTGFPADMEMALGGFTDSVLPQTHKLITYNSGGTHEQNPLGGIPLSTAMNGKKNTVEQGESSFKFKEGKYIFSNKLTV